MIKLHSADGSFKRTESLMDAVHFLLDNPLSNQADMKITDLEITTTLGQRVKCSTEKELIELCYLMLAKACSADKLIPLHVKIIKLIEEFEDEADTKFLVNILKNFGYTEEEVKGTLSSMEHYGMIHWED